MAVNYYFGSVGGGRAGRGGGGGGVNSVHIILKSLNTTGHSNCPPFRSRGMNSFIHLSEVGCEQSLDLRFF